MEDAAILEIANKLGVKVEEVYNVYTKAQPYLAGINIISCIVGVLTGFLVAVVLFNILTSDPDVYERWDLFSAITAGSIGGFFFGFVSSIISQCLLSSYVQTKCPQYFAIKELIGR
jgi:hypothetical protein